MAALICVLERDPLTLKLIGEVLEGEGFMTLRLSETDGVLDVIKDQHPNFLVLDTTLETEDAGWTLLEAIRSDADTRELPIVVCTSDVAVAEKHPMLVAKSPETSILIKPFEPQALIRKIRNALAPLPPDARRPSPW